MLRNRMRMCNANVQELFLAVRTVQLLSERERGHEDVNVRRVSRESRYDCDRRLYYQLSHLLRGQLITFH